MSTPNKYDRPAIGCYFDGANGQQYNNIRVLKLALGFGWEDAEAKRLVDCDELSEDDAEWLHEDVQRAEDFLNGLETRSFLSWSWHDGDFGLWPHDIEDVKEQVEFVSSRSQECPADDFEGEWLHVNDHGNCTLYVRENGQDKEIWSVV